MSFFLNPFSEDFMGNLVLGDRHQSLVFKVPANAGRGRKDVVAYTKGPYDLTGNDADSNAKNILRIQFAIDPQFHNWAIISINISTGAASASAVTPAEVVEALNDDANFNGYFTAVEETFDDGSGRVRIYQNLDEGRMKFFILPGRADEVLHFNAKAGIAELPTYFTRHRVRTELSAAEIVSFTDGCNMLLALYPENAGVDTHLGSNIGITITASNVHDNLIAAAVDRFGVSLGLNNAVIQADWQLINGRSGLFMFQKLTVDGSNRITQIIEYQAGSVVGNFARVIKYTYSGANTNPSQVTEEPYTLASGDLVTP